MSDGSAPNIYTEDWERSIEQGNWGVNGSRIGAAAGAKAIGVAVYEIPPGKKNMPFHAHHGLEEMIVVLSGTPTLRTPEGERRLAEGEVVSFLPGADGAHQVLNHSEAPARYLMLSDKATADVIYYPDSNKISAQAGNWGTPSAVSWMLSAENEMGYLEGEPE